MVKFFSVLKDLTLKNFKAKYIDSILGIIWPIITPLLMALVISFIFTQILKVSMENFSFFVLSGFLPWMFFSRSLSESTNSIIENKDLLKQYNFPREIIPLSVSLSNFLSFILGFIVILPIFIIYNNHILKFLWFLPIILGLFLLFASGFCLILSALNVFIRDVVHMVEIGLLFWFWMTPVFYSVEMVPKSYQIICYLNPLTFFVIIFKDLLFKAKLPELNIVIITILISFFIFITGHIIFSKLSSKFLKKV